MNFYLGVVHEEPGPKIESREASFLAKAVFVTQITQK